MLSIQSFHILILIAAAWLTMASLLRAYRARAKSVEPAGHGKKLYGSLPAILNFIAALFISMSLILGAGLFFQGRDLTALHILAFVILFSSALDLILAMRCALSAVPLRKLIAPAMAAFLGLCVFAFICAIRSVPGNYSDAIQLSYPVKGVWKVIAGGRFSLTNYHHHNPPAQDFALDLVYDQGASEGQKIYAPIDGLILTAVNDRAPASPEAEGNLIVIKSQDGTEVWLAHLKQNSVLVKNGDRVIRGQEIGACGATGSAETAHLHIHAQQNNKPIPMVFGTAKAFLLRNDKISN